MPTYSYKCPECERETELLRKIAESNNLPECTTCGFVMEKQVAPNWAGFNLKGTGYYKPGAN